jgi:hypothetical protein
LGGGVEVVEDGRGGREEGRNAEGQMNERQERKHLTGCYEKESKQFRKGVGGREGVEEGREEGRQRVRGGREGQGGRDRDRERGRERE